MTRSRVVMEKLAENLWLVDGETVSFLGLPYRTRMTVIRLSDGGLWVHSPVRHSAELAGALAELGPVRYLVAPNALHHLFLTDWQQHCPAAEVYGTEKVMAKRPDIHFTGELGNEAMPWQAEINTLMFTGSRAMEEAVFFHRTSTVLLVADLVENFSPQAFRPWQRVLARLTGIVAPHGKMPLDWRLSFLFSRRLVRQHLQQILAWQPEVLVMAHGEIVRDNATQFLRRAFRCSGLR